MCLIYFIKFLFVSFLLYKYTYLLFYKEDLLSKYLEQLSHDILWYGCTSIPSSPLKYLSSPKNQIFRINWNQYQLSSKDIYTLASSIYQLEFHKILLEKMFCCHDVFHHVKENILLGYYQFQVLLVVVLFLFQLFQVFFSLDILYIKRKIAFIHILIRRYLKKIAYKSSILLETSAVIIVNRYP